MIFRRIKAHIEKENWFAVFIDFAIVVFGVFIGIQVANWNAMQQSQRSNTLYLDRIALNVESDADRLRRSRATWSLLIDEATENEQFLSGQAIEALSQWESLLDIYFAAGWSSFSPDTTTYDELLASGQFAGLGDFELRNAITGYYANLQEGSLFYDFNPRLRNLIRGKYDTRMQTYIWKACYSEDVFRKNRDGQVPCAPPDWDVPMNKIIAALRGDSELLNELRFTHSIRVIARTIADTDIQKAEELAQTIRDYNK